VVVAPDQLKRVPWLSIGLAMVCVAATAIPVLRDAFIYERSAVVQGELWRIFSAHFVHYSNSHLLGDMLILFPAALLAELRSRKELVQCLAVSASAVGVAVFIFEPGVWRYAGASGVSYGLLVFVAMCGLHGNPRWRKVCVVILVLVAGKLAAENLFGWRPVNWESEAGFVTVTLAHITGAASGLSVWFACHFRVWQVRIAAASGLPNFRIRQV
jgi:rhomboid family GlyGly-CTERM serine protease